VGVLLWIVIVVLFAFWLLGLLLHVFGGLIHIVLVVAVVLILINILRSQGAKQ